jgi:hypothetical protein
MINQFVNNNNNYKLFNINLSLKVKIFISKLILKKCRTIKIKTKNKLDFHQHCEDIQVDYGIAKNVWIWKLAVTIVQSK